MNKTYDTKNSIIENLSEIYEKYFGYPSNGYFVEVGAYDGEFSSNTCCLADIGWKGLYVEPIHKYYLRCVERHKNNNVEVVNFSIGLDEGEKTIYCGNTLTTLDREQVDRYSEIDWASEISFSETKCNQVRLDTLLTQKNVPKEFDVLVVDVEGKEYEVFQTFNLKEWKPKILIVELEDEHPSFQKYSDLIQKIKELRKFILENGYVEIYKNVVDTIFVHSEFLPQKKKKFKFYG